MICIHAENVTINYCNDNTEVSCSSEATVEQDSVKQESDDKPKEK